MRTSIRLLVTVATAAVLGASGLGTATAANSTVPARDQVSTATDALALGTFEGRWILTQSNGASGSLYNSAPESSGSFKGVAEIPNGTGAVQGQLAGSDVLFEITWSFGHTGRYEGHLGTTGQWSGKSIDLSDPTSTATWTAQRG